MIVLVMGGLYESPILELPEWEPEPLHLPVERRKEPPLEEGEGDGHGSAEEVVGGHVVVIDLA